MRQHLSPIGAAAPRNQHLKLHQHCARAALERSEVDSRPCASDAAEGGGEAGVAVNVLYFKPSEGKFACGAEVALSGVPGEWEGVGALSRQHVGGVLQSDVG